MTHASPPHRAERWIFDDATTQTTEMPGRAVRTIPAIAARQVAALSMQTICERIVDARTVLSWVIGAVGAVGAREVLVGVLVPAGRDDRLRAPAYLNVPRTPPRIWRNIPGWMPCGARAAM